MVVVDVDIVLFEGALLAKVIEDQVPHYVKYLTGSIGSKRSSSSSRSSSSASRRHGLNQRRDHSKNNELIKTCMKKVMDAKVTS